MIKKEHKDKRVLIDLMENQLKPLSYHYKTAFRSKS